MTVKLSIRDIYDILQENCGNVTSIDYNRRTKTVSVVEKMRIISPPSHSYSNLELGEIEFVNERGKWVPDRIINIEVV